MRRNQKGFTLMELMVVIIIVAILAAVAVPLYINYVRDAQRTEARGAIGAVITAEQTFFQQHGLYTNDTFVANPTPATQALNCDLTDALHNWTISVTANNGTPGAEGFVVTATGITGSPAANLTQTLTFARNAAPVWNP
jgi:type IV pilus assembly protein PilE